MQSQKLKHNIKFLDYPYQIFGLEVYDLLLCFLAGFPFIVLAFLTGILWLFLVFIFVFLITAVYLRKKKEGKAFGYYRRLSERLIRKVLRKRRVFYP